MLCTHPHTSVLQNFVIKLSVLPKINFKSVCVGLEEIIFTSAACLVKNSTAERNMSMTKFILMLDKKE